MMKAGAEKSFWEIEIHDEGRRRVEFFESDDLCWRRRGTKSMMKTGAEKSFQKAMIKVAGEEGHKKP